MRATAIAQPNIALIKYWGKRDPERNLPAVGSISVTLRDLFTTMQVRLDDSLSCDQLIVNGAADEAMLPRLSACLDLVGERQLLARVDLDGALAPGVPGPHVGVRAAEVGSLVGVVEHPVDAAYRLLAPRHGAARRVTRGPALA